MEKHEKVITQLSHEIELLKAEKKEYTKSKQIFRIIEDNAVDNIAIASFNLKAKIHYISPSVTRLLGYDPSELLGKSFFDYVHPNDKGFILKLLKSYLSQALKSIIKPGDPDIIETLEYRYKNKAGEWRYLQSNISVLGNDLLAISRDITAQKEMETALVENEKKFKNIFSEAPFGIEYYNSEGQLMDVNRKCLDIFGVKSLNDIKGFKLFEDPNLSEESKSQVKKGNPYQYESEFDFELVKKHQLYPTTKTGKSYLNILITPFNITELNNKGYLVHIEDITKRKQAEKELQNSHEKYRIFFENNDAIILFVDPENLNIIFSNKAAAEYYGYSKTQLSEMKISDINVLESDDIKSKSAAAKRKKHNFFEFKHKLANGEVRDVEVFQTKLFFNDKEIFSIIVHDITERIKAQHELVFAKERVEKSERTFRELFEKSGDAILILKNGYFVDCNDATVKILKYKNKNKFLNVHPSELSPKIQPDGRDSQEKANEMIALTFEKGTHRFEWDHKKSNGEVFPVEVLLTAISNEPNNEVIHSVWRDITYRKKAELKLKAALEKSKESDRLKSAFLANMSHEIRTPMNGILGFANLLKEPGLTGEEQKNYIGIIEKSGERMLNIINDLIDISKVESGQMDVHISKTEINQQIEYIYTFFKPEVENKGMKLFFKTPLTSKEATIDTDREKLFAILTNLVKNAIKYSDTGFIEVGYETKNNLITFYVKDTGTGIAPQMHKVIFDRFIQASTDGEKAIQGAGLGLSISKAYVEMLGGEIWVESQINQGSTFYFTIPIKTNNENKDEVADDINLTDRDHSIKKLKILIAEDEEISVQLLKAMLKEIKKEIIIVRTGKEAVKKSLNTPDIDLILMDIRMPEMNGYDAVRKIREQNKNVVIIAQTAFAIQGDKERAIESGCNAYVSKPISKSNLLDLIKQQFN